jgi:hypothetical protein
LPKLALYVEKKAAGKAALDSLQCRLSGSLSA